MSCCAKGSNSHQGSTSAQPGGSLAYITCPKCRQYAFKKRAYNRHRKVYEDVYQCPSCRYSYPPRG